MQPTGSTVPGWVTAELDNEAALATYRRAGGRDESSCVLLTWEFGQPVN